MFSHVCIGSNDPAAVAAFYDAVLGALGWTRRATDPDWRFVCWRLGTGPALYVGRPFDGGAAQAGNGTMLAFRAPSQAAVDTGYAAGLALGGTDDGAPGLRLRYGADYYGAYLRDAQGNKLHLVHRDRFGEP